MLGRWGLKTVLLHFSSGYDPGCMATTGHSRDYGEADASGSEHRDGAFSPSTFQIFKLHSLVVTRWKFSGKLELYKTRCIVCSGKSIQNQSASHTGSSLLLAGGFRLMVRTVHLTLVTMKCRPSGCRKLASHKVAVSRLGFGVLHPDNYRRCRAFYFHYVLPVKLQAQCFGSSYENSTGTHYSRILSLI